MRNNDVSLALTGNSTYTGPTIVDYTPVPNSTFAGGTLRLTGGGSIAASSAVEVRAGGTLEIDALAGGSNRIGDSSPITLRDGKLVFRGIAAVDAQTETIGALRGSGHSRVTLAPLAAGGSLRLTAASLERVDRGTFEILGQGLGGAFSNGDGNLLLSSAPAGMVGGGGTGAQTSILPYAIGAAPGVSNAGSFLTWDAETGIRPLKLTTEYVNSLAAAADNSNVRLTASVDHAGSKSINSLVLAGGSINGNGTLTIMSGGILHSAGSVAAIRNHLNFGTAEATMFTSGELNLFGRLSGTNGLTKSGSGSLILQGINTISGPLTINDGLVRFSSGAQLGADSSPIVFGGTGAGLSYTGIAPLTLTRPIHLQTGTGSVIVGSGSGRITLSGQISGAGGLMISGPSSIVPDLIALTGTNSYSGPTKIGELVNLEIGSDAALGQGGELQLHGRSRLTLAGDWETNRSVTLVPSTPMREPVKINTSEYTATLNGPLTGSREGLEKWGSGTLRLTGDARTLQGRFTVQAGTVVLSGASATGVDTWNLRAGTRLVIDNTESPLNHRGGKSLSSIVQLEGAGYELRGNAEVPVIERVPVILMRGASTLQVSAVGTSPVMLQIGGLHHMSPENFTVTPEAGTELVIHANNLGAAPEGAVSRITVTGSSPRLGSPQTYGFIPNVYLADAVSGAIESLAFYDKGVDSAGEIGFRPLRAEEYASGVIANPENGGATSIGAHALSTDELMVHGAVNTIASMTLHSGGALTLGDSQKLILASGTVLALPGALESTISGGTLDLGTHRSTIYTAGNLAIASDVTGSGILVKAGSGMLALAGSISLGGGIEVERGTLSLREGAEVSRPMLVNRDGTLALDGNASVAALNGFGSVMLKSHTLSIGGVQGNYEISTIISGTGMLVFRGPASGVQTHHLEAANTFSGGLRLESGRVSWETSESLGTGPITAAGGVLYAQEPQAILNPIATEADLLIEADAKITLAPSAVVSGSRGIELRGTGGLEILSMSTFSGEARSAMVLSPYPGERLGPLAVGGANGSIAASSKIRIGPDGDLLVGSPGTELEFAL